MLCRAPCWQISDPSIVPMDELARLPETGLAVVLLVAISTTVLLVYRVPRAWEVGSAVVRAIAQLAVLSVILVGIISDPLFIGIALLVMFTMAVFVATRRNGFSPVNLGVTGLSMFIGAATALIVVFSTGALELSPRYALSIGAMVIGNSMSIATLSGRNFNRLLVDRWGEVEAWLALGASPWLSTADLAREAVRDSLIPSIDQTKTTGLVVLPGAFVGAIFGGLSPVEAGRFQLVVLASILAAGSVTAVLVTFLKGRSASPLPSSARLKGLAN